MAYQPRRKMVTNSFGNRNFMQPMGRPKHALKVPCFFSFSVGGGGRIFFHFSLVSNMFPNSQCVPQHVPHSTSLLSQMLWQMLSSFHLHRWAKGKELYTSEQKLLFLGSLHSFIFFKSVGPIKLARCRGGKKTWEASHLINRRGEYVLRLLMLRPPAVQYQLGLPTLQGTPAQSAREVLIRCQHTPLFNCIIQHRCSWHEIIDIQSVIFI